MSGCPNGCSQHHIANIGFYGASIKVGEHTIPAYVAHIGGNYEGGEVVYGTRLKVRLPAKRVPDAVERWLRMYEAEREDGEAFNAFAERVGTTRFEDEVRDLAAADRVLAREHEPLHRLAAQGALPGDPGRGRMRGLSRGRNRRGGARRRGRAPPPQPRPGLLLPEGGVGADRHAAAASSRARASSRSTQACSSPRPTRPGARSRTATACTWRSWTPPRRTALRGARRTAAGSARWTRSTQALAGTDAWITGHPARSVAHARRGREGRVADVARGVEVQSARRLERGRRLALHARARPSVQSAPRPGYASIGCAPCTLPGNGREGRWAGQEKTECGLHV